jgi:hypothetical protein
MIKWWKGIFDELKPYDSMSIIDVLSKYQSGLKTFEYHYKAQYDNGCFFVNVSKEHMHIPELKYIHEKFNSPNCDLDDVRVIDNKLTEPNRKLTYSLKENRNFYKPEYETIKFEGHTSNYNNRDGQIRGGFATPNIYSYYYKPKQDKIISGNWVYLELPHELIYNNLRTTANGVDISIAKQFVKEVSETIGWDNLENVKKVVDIYDNQYPDWNHDFPINGFMQLKKDGILFPAAWTFPTKLLYHSFHRLIMTSFSKMNFPYIIPLPYGKTTWEGQSKIKAFFNEGEYKYLNFYFDKVNKKTEYEFTTKKQY